MLLDHPVEVTVAVQRELEPDADAVQRRVPAPDQAHGRHYAPQAPELVVVLPRLQHDVVAEPLGLLVGVGVAPDVHEERGVVDDRPFVLVEAGAIRQLQGDDALAQHVLHRLAEAEIDAERQPATSSANRIRSGSTAPACAMLDCTAAANQPVVDTMRHGQALTRSGG